MADKKKKRLHTDEKIKRIGCESFFQLIYDVIKTRDELIRMWDGHIIKASFFNSAYLPYIKITPSALVLIYAGYFFDLYGNSRSGFKKIFIAERDGTTEYKTLENWQTIHGAKHKRYPRAKIEKAVVELLDSISNNMVEYEPAERKYSIEKATASIVGGLYKSPDREKSKQYVVFDIETNGLRTRNDDLLSISVYDPYSGECYNRFLPLELEPVVLTTQINGITDEDLKNKSPLSQQEVEEVIEYFDLRNRTILSYCGTNFDNKVIRNYFDRHGLTGLDDLSTDDIKKHIHKTGCDCDISKDNLCKIFGIEGIKDIHSGMNDCILEWKIKEILGGDEYIVIDRYLYKYSKDYILPASYLSRYPELRNMCDAYVPELEYSLNEIYRFSLPKTEIKEIQKFDLNMSGIQFEDIIDRLICAEKCDNYEFLQNNKRKMEIIGRFDSRFEEVPILLGDDGKYVSLDKKYGELIKQINEVSEIIGRSASSLIDFLKANVFHNKKILSQEMIISDDGKVLALCDLSSEEAVVEIKSYSSLQYLPSYLLQIYYQKGKRKMYLLSEEFVKNRSGELSGLNFIINEINMTVK